jgi:hypothetical protein
MAEVYMRYRKKDGRITERGLVSKQGIKKSKFNNLLEAILLGESRHLRSTTIYSINERGRVVESTGCRATTAFESARNFFFIDLAINYLPPSA